MMVVGIRGRIFSCRGGRGDSWSGEAHWVPSLYWYSTRLLDGCLFGLVV